MKTIIIPVDFSKASRDAGKYGAAMGRVFNAELLLLHVYTEPAAIGEVPSVLMAGNAQLQSDYEEAIEKEAAYLREQFGVSVRTKVKPGIPSDVISLVAESVRSGLVVMGMKGRGRKTDSLWGSTATSTIRKTRVPVLLVPENQRFVPIGAITLAADFGEAVSPECYDPLIKIASHFRSSLHVLHVRRSEQLSVASGLPGKANLDKILEELPLSFHDTEDNNVEKGITEFLNHHPSELLVMVARRHNLLERLFGTIHTTAMSHRLAQPLLVLKDR